MGHRRRFWKPRQRAVQELLGPSCQQRRLLLPWHGEPGRGSFGWWSARALGRVSGRTG